jgi:hypothetical protein
MAPPVNRRVSPDRRISDESYTDVDRILGYLENINTATHATPADNSAHKGDQLTFTLPQIATALVAILTLGGGVVITWGSLNSQIMAQKVANDLIIGQLRKDLTTLEDLTHRIETKMETTDTVHQAVHKEIATRLSELDATVSQMYNHATIKR